MLKNRTTNGPIFEGLWDTLGSSTMIDQKGLQLPLDSTEGRFWLVFASLININSSLRS